MKHILVSGGSGWLGSKIIKELSKNKKYTVYNASPENTLQNKKNIKFIKLDVTNKNDLKTLKNKKFDAVLHLAAFVHKIPNNKKDERLCYDVNVNGTINIIKSCKSIKHFIFFSSVSVYGGENLELDEESPICPDTTYGKTKYLAETKVKKWAKKIGFEYTILRICSVYGPGDTKSNYYALINAVRKNQMLKIGDCKNKKSILNIENLSEYIKYILINKNRFYGQTIILSDEKPYSLEEIIDPIFEKFNKHNLGKIRIPKIIPVAIGAIFEVIFHNNTVSNKIETLTQNNFFCVNKMKRFGLLPKHTYKEGINKEINEIIKRNYSG